MKTTQTFSILIWANKSKSSGNFAPLFARVTGNGKRAEISLKKKIDLTNWDVKSSSCKGNNEEARTIYSYINQVKAKLFKQFTQIQMLDRFITAEAIKQHYTGDGEVC
jgi:hypothetical protein